ncbi:MAG TPA: endonuclease III [Hungateiclostridium thermocellum]|jgi:endonuclease-3|uniref:Endonuclease III n=2 Tax=Acetivibrio thermocellus TaxID=1515 RepID=A3DEY6_ACET2|nr:endonuclease III [Acetivibrio thermocellus]ABN52515.1 endonuclease III [Acetivibrio thermocellus ATCC 27405]ADU74043.1 endonuclease III [Acetivibrio thermocellus DSM 1313]ALX07981.1 endonuclease III [Acetivibrio thermocellus AD2]ANV75727.1 endonuclease III [Acetivibrio thermocellus DSM 2360]EIC06179.1 endonuclease III [Acetivibrio thermocellus YS]
MMDKKEKVKEIIKIFDELYRDAQCTLDYENPLQLLISTQLAAQCTDARVNVVTKTLFKKYKDARDFANADLKELEQDIKPTGFYHNKAKNIKETCKIIVEKFGGKVPDNMEDLLTLPGVGRKTANVILGDAFGIPGIVVDTHAKRLSNRIGLVNTDDPKKIEFELMEIVPKEKWSLFCHQLVYHGRAVCKARKPECDKCAIIDYCDYGKEHLK